MATTRRQTYATIQIPTDLHATYRDACDRSGRSIAHVTRGLVQTYLECPPAVRDVLRGDTSHKMAAAYAMLLEHLAKQMRELADTERNEPIRIPYRDQAATKPASEASAPSRRKGRAKQEAST